MSSLDPLFNEVLPLVMKRVFNFVTVDDFIEVVEKKDTRGRVTDTYLLVGNGEGRKRRLTAGEANDFIEAVKELDNNVAFKSILNQARYKGQETQAAATESDGFLFPKGILYAADLFQRVVDAVKLLQVAKSNEPSDEGKKGSQGRRKGN